ncbi:hypothetical protein Pcinc_000236 [Petrolisthes cinctipes]|uniref:Uncharacterized protein n=1 Tax=Petrolisthes cinctipes TaxID=88211 RepID=A0AAE1GNX7_PETCI|nr:hypothetical protein Pcinc_000236 [Petrolisthes cinctipes]
MRKYTQSDHITLQGLPTVNVREQNVLLEERKLLNTHVPIKLVCSSVVVGSVVAPSSQINGSSLLLTALMGKLG